MITPVGARPEDMAILQALFAAHVPQGVQVLVFGSRARGVRIKPMSDLDLCLKGEISRDAMIDLREALIASDLPWRVDVVHWDDLTDAFRKIVSDTAVAFAVERVVV